MQAKIEAVQLSGRFDARARRPMGRAKLARRFDSMAMFATINPAAMRTVVLIRYSIKGIFQGRCHVQ